VYWEEKSALKSKNDNYFGKNWIHKVKYFGTEGVCTSSLNTMTSSKPWPKTPADQLIKLVVTKTSTIATACCSHRECLNTLCYNDIYSWMRAWHSSKWANCPISCIHNSTCTCTSHYCLEFIACKKWSCFRKVTISSTDVI